MNTSAIPGQCGSRVRKISTVLSFILGLVITCSGFAVTRPQLKPLIPLNARAAVLIDADTGTLLYAKNHTMLLPPASLTKLVTMYIVEEEIKAGRLNPEQIVEVDKEDCSPYIPYGSSIMYLQGGMKVTLMDLMLGAAVVSGNDAAYALARLVSGSNEAFAERMNTTVKSLGFNSMHFVEPSGLSEDNMVSAYEFAQFCRLYLLRFPDSLAKYHSIPSIVFPRKEHAIPGFTPKGTAVQYNRNTMLFKYDGCDGLKTGYIIEVGYNNAVTALRGGSRYIAVTLGGMGTPQASGTTHRSKDGTALLDWAFDNFQTVRPDTGPLPVLRTWFGTQKTVKVRPLDVLAVTLPIDKAKDVRLTIDTPISLEAPIKAGAVLGKIDYYAGTEKVRTVNLVAESDVERGGFFLRVKDGIERFFSRLFGAESKAAKARATGSALSVQKEADIPGKAQ